MVDVPSCSVCMEEFNQEARRPLLLDCGHTFCSTCAAELYQHAASGSGFFICICPRCRQKTKSRLASLRTNYSLLDLVQPSSEDRKGKGKRKKYWCLNCENVANDACEENHTLCRLLQERVRQLKDTKAYLETTLSSLHTLEELLMEKVHRVTDALKCQVNKVTTARKVTKEALDLLQDSLEITGSEWDQSLGIIEEAHKSGANSQAFNEQTMDFMVTAERCEVVVHGAHGCTWRGDINLQAESAEGAVVLAMMTSMQRASLLNAVKYKQKGEREDSKNQGGETDPPSEPQPNSLESTLVDKHKFVPLSGGQEIIIHKLSEDPEWGKRKSSLLAPLDPPVTSVKDLWLNDDSAFGLKLLRCHSHTLERVELNYPEKVHLEAVAAMPRLRDLLIFDYKGKMEDLLDVSPNFLRLDTLELEYVSLEMTLAIISKCGGARRLYTCWAKDWPIERLVELLREKPERTAFQTPVQVRLFHGCGQTEADCDAQLVAIKESLPSCKTVWCTCYRE